MNTPSLNAGSVLQRLKARRSNFAKSTEATQETHASTIVLPPFESQLAVISAQRNKWKALFVCAASVGVLASSGLAYFLNHQLFTKMKSDFLIVPGAAEFMRIRPNLIPDAVVFSFAEYVATYAGTFTYRNAKSHFASVAERMAPELKGRFLRDTDSRLGEWQRRRVDQVFAFEPINRFDVLNDQFGPKYSVVVKGSRTQYADGTLLAESEENLLLVLRPHLQLSPGSRADESLFVIERLEWITRAQAETLLATRVRDDVSAKKTTGGQ
jgi:hypothetical protein